MKKIIFALMACAAVMTGCRAHKAEDRPTTGGYSIELKVDSDDMAVWNAVKATTPQLNEFTPVTVRRQVVAGMNYRFNCRDKQGGEHEVHIFNPLPEAGTPVVTWLDGKRP